jgi:hypothetical protein
LAAGYRLAEHTERRASMARRILTDAEEKALIEEVRSHIDDEEYWDFEHPVAVEPVTHIPYKVALPRLTFLALARLAMSRGMTVEQLILEAVANIDTTGFDAEPAVQLDLAATDA